VCNRKIQCPTIPVWWQKKEYCFDMPNVVSAIDGTSHEIQIPSNEPQQKIPLHTFYKSTHVEFKTLATVETLTPKHK
jgi:hypothetical protein